MGQCFSVSKEMVIEAGRRISEASEDIQVMVHQYNVGRYHHVNTEVTDEEDTNIISYDEPQPEEAPVSSLVQGEKEIEKIFEDSIIDEHI